LRPGGKVREAKAAGDSKNKPATEKKWHSPNYVFGVQ
jgi:hypothetical protein